MAIRPYAPLDVNRLYDVCLRTGADGEDGRGLYRDPRLLGSVYVGPYLALEPGLAFVLDDDSGHACGYVLGARDTAAFERACELRWWPDLRAQHPVGSVADGSADAEVVALIHSPRVVDRTVLASYPSHLHIDLLPSCQGVGGGRALMTRLLAALTAAGSPGVHLVVSATNERAIRFYRRMGFVDLAASGGGLTMGRRLEALDPALGEN
jgi:ribosomal protein S18 acetylase RimI-like enzyme